MKEKKNVDKSEGKFATELFFWAQALVLSLVVLVLFNVFFFRVSSVVGSSMEPTLQNGDRVFLRIIGYTEPKRGDIVVIQAPEFDDDPIVKRIIAVGGDEIKIDFFGNVYINGEVQYEPYILETISPNSLGDQVYPMTIPEGYVFFMGDNRNGSTDSRESIIGIQPVSNIIGKVEGRIWPLNKIGGVS